MRDEGNISTGHRETLEQVGEISSLETEHDLIRTYVNGTLWKKKKFVALSQGELDWNSQICRRILMALKIPDKSQKNDFWASNRDFVRKCLVIKRNNVVSALKQNIFSKYMKYRGTRTYTVTNFWTLHVYCLTEWIARVLNDGDIIPTYDELSNYRGARDLNYLDIWWTYFFPAVVGTWYFKKNATCACPSLLR
jgi:hypothetical protein